MCACVCAPCAGVAPGGVGVLDDPSEEDRRRGAPAGGDCEVSDSTRRPLASPPPAGEESDCGTDGGGRS